PAPGPQGPAFTTGSTEINWVKFYGHSLVLNRQLQEEILAVNLKKSGLCADGEDAISTYEYFPGKGKNNITSFKMRIKLKDSIKK
ncbi:MAG: hypothetical protein ACYC4Q_04760, partial [Victivallaceae bacterium]